ncbi:hypothetical protein FRC01_001364 [Tulasnella sp. 417]|nr:hypothetical protein FRC01_001364 [Tulasnella sp. 417]
MTDTYNHIQGSNWWAKGVLTDDLGRKVSCLNFVAHPNVQNLGGDGQPPTNHWSIFLSFPDNESLHLDMIPANGIDGTIMVGKRHCATEESVDVVSMIPSSDSSVDTIFRIIIDNGRDKYKFAPVGEGCRFWLATLADDLANARIISQPDAESARDALGKYYPYPRGTPPVERPIQKGCFL